MSNSNIKTDCFAAYCNKRVYTCRCLVKMDCRFSECPFYKTKDVISTKEIEKSIQAYAIRHVS